MSKTSFRRLITAFALSCALALMPFALIGCGSPSNDQQKSSQSSVITQETISVNVTIDASAAEDKSIGDFTRTVSVKNGATAYDVLQETGVSIEAEGSYVTSIDGLAAGEFGPSSGWTYLVNDTMPTVAADEYEIHEGEQVMWLYVTSFDDLG